MAPIRSTRHHRHDQAGGDLQLMLDMEIEKRTELQNKLEEVQRVHELYADRTAMLEELLYHKEAVRECSDASGQGSNKQEEDDEVQSNFNSCSSRSRGLKLRDFMCRSCHMRMAKMVFLPCNHLSVCFDCHPTTMACPICNAQRITSFMVGFI